MSAVWYEVRTLMLTGKICLLSGPFLLRDENYRTLFQQGLAQGLGQGERVETDQGYVGINLFWT